MTAPTQAGRLFAGFVSLIAWAGLAIQFYATQSVEQDVVETLWVLVRFFTILTNLVCAVMFGALALGRTDLATPSRLGYATISILLVGVVYALLLAGLKHLAGAAAIADFLLHKATPLLVPLGWLVAAPKGGLARRDPWLWAVFPIVYLGYALLRGIAEHLFAYPFLDFVKHGWLHVFLHAIAMAAGFIVTGQALVALDRRMARRES